MLRRFPSSDGTIAEAVGRGEETIVVSADLPCPRSLGWSHFRDSWFRALRRTVWNRVPRPIRRAAMRHVLARNRVPLAEDAPAAEPVCVVGLLSTPTGIGEGGRLAVRALARLGHDVRSVDVSHLLMGFRTGGLLAPPLEQGGGTLILHFNPDHLAATLTMLGRERLQGKRIIGYWAWELPLIPDHWIPALQEVDEIWVPSRFVAESVRAFTGKPVRVVPHPVVQRPPGRSRRAHFGIADEFVALTMFSFAAYERKNPVAAIRAFRLAFGEADDRLLILKCLEGEAWPAEIRALKAEIGGARNIRIDERPLADDERLDLVASADVLLSLHRSEGCGLTMAEAMLSHVPVIATGWSGNLDYMDEDSALLVPTAMVEGRNNGRSGCWAEPDVAVAAVHLADLAADPERFEPMRQSAFNLVQRKLGLEAFRDAVQAALPAPKSVSVIPGSGQSSGPDHADLSRWVSAS